MKLRVEDVSTMTTFKSVMCVGIISPSDLLVLLFFHLFFMAKFFCGGFPPDFMWRINSIFSVLLFYMQGVGSVPLVIVSHVCVSPGIPV